MSEKLGEHFEEELKQEQVPETELQPQAEMPENFVEPKGKSGKWGEVVENKELGVRYREKVIELSKHRQEETGIKRIRRRELLPPFPEGLLDTSGKHIDNWGENPQSPVVWSSGYEFDDVYKFLTNNGYPSSGTLVHTVNPTERLNTKGKSNEDIEKFKKEGLYFQEIRSPHRGGVFCFGSRRTWGDKFNTPVFVFGNKNRMMVEYIDSVLKDENRRKVEKLNDDPILKCLRERSSAFPSWVAGEVDLDSFGRKKGSKEEPLRWCHSEVALVPTKRSLNVLFFETGDEDKKEKE